MISSLGTCVTPTSYVVSEDRAVLVDFDWAASGKDGESRHPTIMMLNPKNTCADEVVPYSIMRKSHDLWQLKRLIALCEPASRV